MMHWRRYGHRLRRVLATTGLQQCGWLLAIGVHSGADCYGLLASLAARCSPGA
jgi:hypothetical protein